MKPRCSAVIARSLGQDTHGCLLNATIEYEGDWYCRRHFPPEVLARQRRQDDKRLQASNEAAILAERRARELTAKTGLPIHPELDYRRNIWRLYIEGETWKTT